jgi:hypothetical protein
MKPYKNRESGEIAYGVGTMYGLRVLEFKTVLIQWIDEVLNAEIDREKEYEFSDDFYGDEENSPVGFKHGKTKEEQILDFKDEVSKICNDRDFAVDYQSYRWNDYYEKPMTILHIYLYIPISIEVPKYISHALHEYADGKYFDRQYIEVFDGFYKKMKELITKRIREIHFTEDQKMELTLDFTVTPGNLEGFIQELDQLNEIKRNPIEISNVVTQEIKKMEEIDSEPKDSTEKYNYYIDNRYKI